MFKRGVAQKCWQMKSNVVSPPLSRITKVDTRCRRSAWEASSGGSGNYEMGGTQTHNILELGGLVILEREAPSRAAARRGRGRRPS